MLGLICEPINGWHPYKLLDVKIIRGSDVNVFLACIAAAGFFSAMFFAGLWLMEWRRYRRFRLLIKPNSDALAGTSAKDVQLSQALNFRDGGVASAIVSFRRLIESIQDWAPELLLNTDIANDIGRVDQFLNHLLNHELVNTYQHRLAEANKRDSSMSSSPTPY